MASRRWSDRERNAVARQEKSQTQESWGSGLASLSVASIVTGARDRSMTEGGADATLDALEAATGVNKLRHRDTSALSDGQRRAVQLFVALAPPKLEVILLDKACADLDALVRDRVLTYVRATKRRSSTRRTSSTD